MNNLLPLFSNNILPILLVAGVGYLIGKYLSIDPQALSKVVFFAFSPCLVFTLLTHSKLESAALLQMTIHTVIVTLLMAVIAWLVGKALKLDRKILVALILASMFANSGNYGLSLNNFAFGQQALAYASIYFVTSGILVYTVGIVIASMGQASLKESLFRSLKYPTVYAVVFALLFSAFDFSLPLAVDRAVILLGEAAIPTMLILLGLQLQRSNIPAEIRALSTANILRLAISPLVAYGVATMIGLQGSAFQAGVAESSMPAAVMVTVLATEFDVAPEFATTVVTTTTLLSPLTLTPLLAFLGG